MVWEGRGLRQYQRWLVVITITVLAAGWLAARLAVKVTEDEQRSKLLLRTVTAAAMINHEQVERLTATPADTGTAEYEYLKRQLTAVRSLNPDCRFVYLLKIVDGQVVFLMDSEPDTSADYSPPGSPYYAASGALRDIFLGSQPFVEGALGDKWGVWISGIAAVRNPADGQVMAALVMDIDARSRQSGVRATCLIVAGVTAALLGIIFSAFYILRNSAATAKKVYLKEKQAKEAAESLSQAKSQFLAYLSHEVRTPVTGILGLGEFLEATRLNGQQRDYVSAIVYSARSLLSLLNDVLDLSKIQAGKMAAENVHFEFRKVLTGVKTILQAAAANKGIGLTITIDPAIPPVVCGDPVRLRQVLLNIAGNAVKFTDAGGVDVKSECLQLNENAVTVKVTVCDTGIGLTQDEINKLFQPFVQTEGTSTRKYLGSGLGLSISASLIKMMGGDFGIDSAKGIGSSFWFTVTLQTAQEGSIIHDLTTPNASPENNISPCWAVNQADRATGKAGDVLIVEDNSVNRQVVKVQLERLDLTADLAATGQEAVLLTVKNNYKLILMDCGLPLMDGFATTQAIREYEALNGRHTPIIALTASSLPTDREKCLAAGMDDYVTKPVAGKELRRIIERWLICDAEDGIDRTVLGQLKELADSCHADINLFINAYIEEVLILMTTLRQAVLQEDTGQASHAAHGLKSMSVTIGAQRIAGLSNQLEQLARQGRLEEVRALLGRVEDECRQVGSALKNAVSQL